MKNAAIAVLGLLVIWLAIRVIELENFRYATAVGFCLQDTPTSSVDAQIQRYECLKKQNTRTNWMGHLYFALIDGV
jgi:hypothetical protein